MVLPAWTAPALALVGVLGPFLLARRAIRRPLARALVLVALVGLAVVGALAAFGGATFDALDAVLGGALVALAAVGVKRVYALATLLVAALAAARALGLGTQGEVVAALVWAAALVLAAGLAGARFMRSQARPRAR